jgi:hypothetical protein
MRKPATYNASLMANWLVFPDFPTVQKVSIVRELRERQPDPWVQAIMATMKLSD